MDARVRRRYALVALVAAVAVALVVVVATYGTPSPSGGGGTTRTSPLAFTFAANSSAEVQTLLTTLRPYVLPGDAFDLVSGSPEGVPLSLTNLNRWAAELRSAYPSNAIYAHTAGVANYATVAAGVSSDFAGVLYDYEPGFEPEFTYNFTQTLSDFANVSAIARAHGIESVGYPIGRPILGNGTGGIRWDYAALAGEMDQLVVQSQTYCHAGMSAFADAVETVQAQYAAEDLPAVPEFQVTIGNATTSLPNGVTSSTGIACADALVARGLPSVYVWWDEGGVAELVQFLAVLESSS